MKNLLFACVALIFLPMIAQDGSPDLSFGDNGVVLIQMGNNPPNDDSYLWGMDDASNGNLIVYAEYNFTGEFFYLISLLDNGDLDLSWGVDGFLELADITTPELNGLEIQSDDKILIKNSVNNVNGLYRYLPNGSLDVDFALDGYLSFVTASNVFNTFYQNDFIYYQCTTGSDTNYTIVIERYSSDGVLDNSYGNNGVLEIPFGSENDPDILESQILLSGDALFFYEEIVNESDMFQVAKFTSQGILDSSYGINGVSETIPIDSPYKPQSMVASSEGSSYLNFAYWDPNNNEYTEALFKVNPNGFIDINFADQGRKDNCVAKIIQENGRILTDSPLNDWEGGYYPFYRRFYDNGNQDTSFAFNPPIFGALGSTYPKILKSGKLLLASNSIWYDDESRLIFQRLHNNPLDLEDFPQVEINITPNPSEGIFQLTFENGELLGTPYSLTDISGKLIQTGVIDELTDILDLTGFAPGMYFLNIDQQTYKLLKN